MKRAAELKLVDRFCQRAIFDQAKSSALIEGGKLRPVINLCQNKHVLPAMNKIV